MNRVGRLRQLKFAKFGNPLEVLELHQSDVNPFISQTLQPKQLLIKYLASPINPADINTIQGTYGVKPPLPAVPGNEGLACVLRHGDAVDKFKGGDNVILVGGQGGSWSTHGIVKEEHLVKVDKDLDLEVAAQMKVNPCTAFRMLKDFVSLKPGDSIIQNGANSAVGVYSIQLARLWNVRSINIIRDRPNIAEVIRELEEFGADYVLTETQVRQPDTMKEIFKNIQKPKLMLNCVGGKNARDCLRHLDHSGYCVTYGGMSRQPFEIPLTSLIFNNHAFFGFWMSRWYESCLSNEKNKIESMLSELSGYFKSGQLRAKRSKMIGLDEFQEALKALSNNFANVKYIFRPE